MIAVETSAFDEAIGIGRRRESSSGSSWRRLEQKRPTPTSPALERLSVALLLLLWMLQLQQPATELLQHAWERERTRARERLRRELDKTYFL